MILFYNLGLFFYALAIRLAAPFNPKARKWIRGRKGWKKAWANMQIPGEGPLIWVHCASLGEFEQGRPVMERIREDCPGSRILLTFFSPSGFEVRKDFEGADKVLYLPLDTYYNARYFVQLFQPDLAIFVKYEFWYHFLYFLKKSGVPLFLVSGIFRENHIFFRPWGGLFRRTLRAFETLFVQNEFSRKMLAEIGIRNVVVTGDTRFDRVIQITERAKDIPEAMQFSQRRDMVVCGSTWPEDEAFITAYINAFPEHFKWIIAPHEINEDHLKQLEDRLTVQTVRFSKFSEQDASARVLLIDNYGMLSTLYRYACMAYVGGGFGKGLHNILEAATYGIPVLFGPRHQRFREAIALNYRGGGFALQAPQEFASYVRRLRNHPEVRKMAGDEAYKYIHNSRGATEKVMMDLRPQLQAHCS